MLYKTAESSPLHSNSLRPCDIMVCAMARLIKDKDIVFHGVSSHMPMIALLLAKALHAPHAVHLNIPGGVDPKPRMLMKHTSAGAELFENSVSEFPLAEVFDLSMRGGLDVAFLSGIQFDVQGNVNASVIGDYHKPKVRMPGGAGSAVLIPTAKRAIIWRTKHDIRTFVKKVDFVTTKGNIDRIVTPLCIFKYQDGELVLDTIHPTSSLEEVIANTAFEIRNTRVEYTPVPTSEEMMMLKRIDTKDYRNIEF
ncbi:MAG: coenzyme transferase [Herbinix sp.]|jgi:glutaconate CoA-transferase subunit B|nr:coenzyme transferase [Herbinix sp.]